MTPGIYLRDFRVGCLQRTCSDESGETRPKVLLSLNKLKAPPTESSLALKKLNH